jgi:hypothetical protein
VEARQGSIFFWNPAWSPDQKRLAVLSVKLGATVGENAWSLQILDPSSGESVSTVAFPQQVGTKFPILGGFPYTMISPDKFVWSPDGRYILISWGYATLVEVETGRIVLISPDPVFADWDANGLLWVLEVAADMPERFLNAVYQIDPINLERRDLASRAQFDAEGLGLGFSYARLVTSPSGSKIALVVAKQTEPRHDVIRIYDITAAKFDLSAPNETIESDTVLQLEWSPDEKQLVATHVAPSGDSAAIATDIIDLGSGRLTNLSRLPISNISDVEGLAFVKHLSWTR